jgi:hypothetical protein
MDKLKYATLMKCPVGVDNCRHRRIILMILICVSFKFGALYHR